MIILNTYAQSSLGLNGFWGVSPVRNTVLNGFESNPSNYFPLKDWGFNVMYAGEFSNEVSSNIYMISLSKKIVGHSLSARYTPGYQKEFIFSSGESIIFEDSSVQSLNSKFSYKELFGFGYSYLFSADFSAGFSLRMFEEDFSQESLIPVFSDTLYIVRKNESTKRNFWKADLGINYFISDFISISVSSINLLNFGESYQDETLKEYELKTNRGLLAGMSLAPAKQVFINLLYESDNSFVSGINYGFNFGKDNLSIGLTAFHDKHQHPFLAGILPSITYSNDLWGVTLTGVKYFSDRSGASSFNTFKDEGINNILNNRYSFNKAALTFSLSLNTLIEKRAELISIDLISEIFPTQADEYIDNPIAIGRVVNLTDKPLIVKPSCKIQGVNSEIVQSPPVTIAALDTAEVKFYGLISDSYNKERSEISSTDFYLITDNENTDDHIQKPLLVNGVNSWDGNVKNLPYFIKKDLSYSMDYSKNILSKFKNELDTVSSNLLMYYKIKTLFADFIKNVIYVSDPRATAEYVQFPHQTKELKGGDCDDLSVCFSAILESVGIETALVDYKETEGLRHVNLLVNTELSPAEAGTITANDRKIFVRKNEKGEDEVWLPIETTSLTDFETAWKTGSSKFYSEAIDSYGLAKNKVEIIDVY
jgi:hypothetical protein